MASIAKKQVVVGMLGSVLDGGTGIERWQKWRPTVSLAQQDHSFAADRIELIFDPKFEAICNQVKADIAEISPATKVQSTAISFNDPWDFEEVYAALYDFARDYKFNTAEEDYFVHITTGTHTLQICLFLLVESRHLPAKLVQSSPPPRDSSHAIGGVRVIDLNLSAYDQLAKRFSREHADGRSLLRDNIQTRNAKFNSMITQLERIATSSRHPILLSGPTGAGKTWPVF